MTYSEASRPARRLGLWALALTAAVSIAPARAHDFWLEAAPWRLDRPADVDVSLHVGAAGEQSPWAAAPDRIVSFRSIAGGRIIDERAALVFDEAAKRWSGRVRVDGAGPVALVLETNDSYIELPAERFNDYVRKEGLTLAAQDRAARGAENSPGRERYSRRAEILMFVGNGPREAPPPSTGATLEIKPLDSPFSLADREPLRFRVSYEGAPLAGATVKVESLDIAMIPTRTALTDAKGGVAFVFPADGAWKVSVVWTRPLKGDPKADFETVFSSVTFGL